MEIIVDLAKRLDISVAKSKEFVNSFLTLWKEALLKKKGVSFIGYGTFKVVGRKKRKYRNPNNGEIVIVPARKVVKFSAGTAMLAELNGQAKKTAPKKPLKKARQGRKK